jgi:hypothetical protein
LANIMRAPTVSGYYAIKERAMHSAMAQRKLAAKRTPGRNPPFMSLALGTRLACMPHGLG